MSYALDVSDKAKAALTQLEVELQERTWDHIEYLAANPWEVRSRAGGEPVVADFTMEQTGGVHYVFITLRRDDKNRVLHVDSIGDFLKLSEKTS